MDAAAKVFPQRSFHTGAAACAEDPASGRAVYAPAAQLRRLKANFGLVFQNFNLFPHYTVLKNIVDAPICVQKRRPAEATAAARAYPRRGDRRQKRTRPPS